MYENENVLVEHLAYELIKGRLALILGSGISKLFELPNWDTLVDKCCKIKNVIIPSENRDNLKLAEYVRNRCSSIDEYHNTVITALYENVSLDIDDLRSSSLLQAIGNLLSQSTRGNVNNVVTYNFDDLLENYLRFGQSKRVNIVTEAPAQLAKKDVNVFHPHGFLPKNQKFTSYSSKWIIFDRFSYAERVSEMGDWAAKILSILKEHTCLFIGLSFDDYDLDTDIIKAKENHPTLGAGNAYWGIRISKKSKYPDIDLDELTCMHNRRIYIKYIDDYTNDLPQFVFKISQKASDIMDDIGI